MIERIKKFFYNEYEVTIWHTGSTEPKAVFLLRKILRKSNTKIEGIDMNKKPFEFSSPEPFNYQIRKIH
jgi:DNA modification methylase